MNRAMLHDMKILVVDDEILNVTLLEQLLGEARYARVKGITDSRLTLSLYHEFQPDIILMDLMMPHLDGFALMEQLSHVISADDYVPILVLTADVNLKTKRRALTAGATDFLTKPFDQVEVLLRMENLLRARWQHVQLRSQNQLLDQKVHERTRELEAAQVEIVAHLTKVEESQAEVLNRLAQASEFRDDDTGQHTHRVGEVAAQIATEMGLCEHQVDLIRRAAPLHDVGKIGIPDSVLLKPGSLSNTEFEQMKTHTTIGATLLGEGGSDLVKMAEEIAMSHHERWNGKGYPRGLQGDSIPLAGRIVAVADVFDALTHDRPYKKAWTFEQAVDEIKNQSGSHFDPLVVDAFLRASISSTAL